MNDRRHSLMFPSDSVPWPWSTLASAPVLAVCPVPVSVASVSLVAAQEFYRRAYERALAAARPSRYALALGASRN